MKIIVAVLLMVLLTGCATVSTYSKKEQLLLIVPQQFLEPPLELREL